MEVDKRAVKFDFHAEKNSRRRASPTLKTTGLCRRTELEELGGEAFVGTPQLRAHAHGFFMDARLYKRLRSAAAAPTPTMITRSRRSRRSWPRSRSRVFGELEVLPCR